uniref:Uncharacterized protein n=1 Tax=Fagus sylvatica TaxID=28930 RepID=A0A2N9GII6_FAGSY
MAERGGGGERGGFGRGFGGGRPRGDRGARRASTWTPRRGGEMGSSDKAWTTRLCR